MTTGMACTTLRSPQALHSAHACTTHMHVLHSKCMHQTSHMHAPHSLYACTTLHMHAPHSMHACTTLHACMHHTPRMHAPHSAYACTTLHACMHHIPQMQHHTPCMHACTPHALLLPRMHAPHSTCVAPQPTLSIVLNLPATLCPPSHRTCRHRFVSPGRCYAMLRLRVRVACQAALHLSPQLPLPL